MTPTPQTQLDKFKAAARHIDCDEDEARWDVTLKKVAKQSPRQRSRSDDAHYD